MTNIFKKCIESVRPYEPGKPIKEVQRELGLRNIIKLASNENALGASPKAVKAMRQAIKDVYLYPESSCHYLVEKLSKKLGLSTRQIIAGNGSNEIIEFLVRGFLNEGEEVISSENSFLVYPILTQVCGGRYISVPMKQFRFDLDGILAAVTDRTRLIFIANPNNPTGTYVGERAVRSFLAKVPDHAVVCFDEAYVDFTEADDFPNMVEILKETQKNVVLLRTFSKSYGLAGLRIGYGLASEAMVGYFHKIRQPFNVNLVAQAAATAALDDKAFLRKTQALVSKGRRQFYEAFDRLGLRYLPSEANFVLVDIGTDGEEAFQDFLRHGLIVRSMKAYGLKHWIRVTVGLPKQNEIFCKLLKNYLAHINRS